MKFTKQHFNKIVMILHNNAMEITSMEKNNKPLTYDDLKYMHVCLVTQFSLLFKECNSNFNEDEFLNKIY